PALEAGACDAVGVLQAVRPHADDGWTALHVDHHIRLEEDVRITLDARRGIVVAVQAQGVAPGAAELFEAMIPHHALVRLDGVTHACTGAQELTVRLTGGAERLRDAMKPFRSLAPDYRRAVGVRPIVAVGAADVQLDDVALAHRALHGRRAGSKQVEAPGVGARASAPEARQSTMPHDLQVVGQLELSPRDARPQLAQEGFEARFVGVRRPTQKLDFLGRLDRAHLSKHLVPVGDHVRAEAVRLQLGPQLERIDGQTGAFQAEIAKGGQQPCDGWARQLASPCRGENLAEHPSAALQRVQWRDRAAHLAPHAYVRHPGGTIHQVAEHRPGAHEGRWQVLFGRQDGELLGVPVDSELIEMSVAVGQVHDVFRDVGNQGVQPVTLHHLQGAVSVQQHGRDATIAPSLSKMASADTHNGPPVPPLKPKRQRENQNWILDYVVANTGVTHNFEYEGRLFPATVKRYSMIPKVMAKQAMRQEALARAAAAAGHRETAALLYFKAAQGYRSAQHAIKKTDQRKIFLHRKLDQCYDGLIEHSPYPIERVEIPWEGKSISGLLHVLPDRRQAPLVIFLPGMDMTKESTPDPASNPFRERGMHLLAIDGPGVGSANLRGMHVTHDNFERAFSAAVDYAISRPEVDATRIAACGVSMGSFWGARSAAHEHRLAACAVSQSCLGGKKEIFETGVPDFKETFMYMAGLEDEDEFDRLAERLTAFGYGPQIRCPLLIVAGEFDPIGP